MVFRSGISPSLRWADSSPPPHQRESFSFFCPKWCSIFWNEWKINYPIFTILWFLVPKDAQCSETDFWVHEFFCVIFSICIFYLPLGVPPPVLGHFTPGQFPPAFSLPGTSPHGQFPPWPWRFRRLTPGGRGERCRMRLFDVPINRYFFGPTKKHVTMHMRLSRLIIQKFCINK